MKVQENEILMSVETSQVSVIGSRDHDQGRPKKATFTHPTIGRGGGGGVGGE